MTVSIKAEFVAVLMLGGVLASSGGHAEEPLPAQSAEIAEAPDNGGAYQIGSATSTLLTLQREGTASRNRLPMLGDEATAAYARYLDSFTHKIPAYFSSSVTSGGENASQGSGN
jgi:hypothetical protein